MTVEKSNSFNNEGEFPKSVIGKMYGYLPKTLEELVGKENYRELCEKIVEGIIVNKPRDKKFYQYEKDNFFTPKGNEFIKNIWSLISSNPSDLEKLTNILNLREEYILQLKNVIDSDSRLIDFSMDSITNN